MEGKRSSKDVTAPIADNVSDNSAEEVQPTERQDAFVVFSNEKDLRHHEAIRIKASLYTGIALRVKVIQPMAMENLLYAIDLDSGVVARNKQAAKEKQSEADAASKENPTSQRNKGVVNTMDNQDLAALKPGIVNLRFEECKLTRKSAILLSEWLKQNSLIETIGLIKMTFEDATDFKKVADGIKLNAKLNKLSFQYMNFDEEVYGTSIGRILSDSRTIRELDVTHVIFNYRTFYDMCQSILNERCRLNVLKLRGLLVGEIEGKIIQFILMKNKQIHTMDLSECRSEDPIYFDYFLEKFNQFCYVKFLTLEKMQPELSQNIETLGESLADNTSLEVLILKDNKIKWNSYQNFWTAVMPNRSIQKINLQKTELSDRVIEKLVKYIEQEGIVLADLDLSKNVITDVGLKLLSHSMMNNKSIMYLNLSQNKLKEEGFNEFSELMKINTTIKELAFGGNLISNEGVAIMAEFLQYNKTLEHLDLSRNSFNDSGFEVFANALAFNEGLLFLDIAKNKEITDEGSLLTLADALTVNKKLRTIDLSGLIVRKPFLKQSFDQALKRNITLQQVIGKIPQNIIQNELDQNLIIERDVLPLYINNHKAKKDEFSLALVEPDVKNHTRLNLKGQQPRLIKAAFKLIRNYDIRSVDFTEAGIADDSMRILSQYMRSDPNLRSIILDRNQFTDEGLDRLTSELHRNTKLAHLSIKGCTNITREGLQKLCTVISSTNTSLFQVDLDMEQFDKELATLVITESALNRDIQNKLKPVKIVTTIGPNGEVIKVTTSDQTSKDEAHQPSYTDGTESANEEEPIAQDPMSPDLKDRAASSMLSQRQSQQNPTDVTHQDGESMNMTNQSVKRMDSLKSPTKKGKMEESHYKTIVEVKFCSEANVAECFESAIKAWRIYQPNIIRGDNLNLTDDHVMRLCDFLNGKQMISHLNLRRNMISNAGAKCLGNFIQNLDETLTVIDVSRNRIGQDGGQSILDALNGTTRITDCQIKYGNPISNKLGRVIDREIKANIQAVNYANENQKNGVFKYELIDKGPDHMRCAIKMAQLHDILHLSLPDNMLALEDARMIADLIKRNTPLRKLNLSTNQLDADCAALIANSLIFNQNLKLLDVSKNLLGDLGVYLLLTPLVRKHLQERNIVSKATPVIREKECIQGKNPKQSRRLFKSNVIILTKLQYLGLEDNMTTEEAYKQVWLTLLIDPEISIKIEDPVTIRQREIQSLFSSPSTEALALKSKPAQAPSAIALSNNTIMPDPTADGVEDPNNETNRQLLGDRKEGSSEKTDEPKKKDDEESENDSNEDSEEISDEKLFEMERIQLEKERQQQLAEKKQKAFESKVKRKICYMKFCCFQDEEKEFNLTDKIPSNTQISCWRFLRARRQTTKFYQGDQTLNSLEKSPFTSFVSLLISFNYLILYAVVIVPFVLILMHDETEQIEINGVYVNCETNQDACAVKEEENQVNFNNFILMVNGGVLFYSMLCESLIICVSLKPTNTKCNSYLICQVLTGLTMRAVILISAQVIAVFVQDVNIVNFALGVTLTSTLVLSQLRAFQIWLLAIKKDKNCILPKVQQNMRICMSTNYLALSTLYQKVNVEANDAAYRQTQALEAERNSLMAFSFADEDSGKKKNKKSSEEMKQKLQKCKCVRWSSPKFYQMIMNDIPLIFCQPFAYIFGLMDEVNAIAGIMLTLIDLIFMLIYLSYDEELSIDSKQVYEMSQKRLETKQADLAILFGEQFSINDLEDEHDQNGLLIDRDQDGEQNENLDTDNQNREINLNPTAAQSQQQLIEFNSQEQQQISFETNNQKGAHDQIQTSKDNNEGDATKLDNQMIVNDSSPVKKESQIALPPINGEMHVE